MFIDKMLKKVFGTKSDREIKRLTLIVEDINSIYEELHSLTDEELKAKTESVIKMTVSQFEKTKKKLISNVIKSLQGSMNEDNFSLTFESKCMEYKISEREKDILLLFFKGMQYKDIGEKLFISENTVRTHVYRIYKKCKVGNKLELMNIFKV